MLVCSGCAGGGGDSKQVAVGSKEFTEQLILGQIAIKALEEHGFTVIDRTGLAGTEPARVALENGEIDLYWEYTGTAWLVALGHDQPITRTRRKPITRLRKRMPPTA